MEEGPYVVDSAKAVEFIRAIPDARVRYRTDKIFRLLALNRDAMAPTALAPILIIIVCLVIGSSFPQYAGVALVCGLVLAFLTTRWSLRNVTKPTLMMHDEQVRAEIAARGDNGLKESLLELANIVPELQEQIMEVTRLF